MDGQRLSGPPNAVCTVEAIVDREAEGAAAGPAWDGTETGAIAREPRGKFRRG